MLLECRCKGHSTRTAAAPAFIIHLRSCVERLRQPASALPASDPSGHPLASMLCQQTVRGSCLKSSTAKLSARAPMRAISSRRHAVVTKAAMDTNIFVNLIASTACGAMATAVTLVTAENTDAELERIKTVEGAAPVAAAIAVDAIAHSIPGLSILLQLLAEPTGAAAGVAYMMTLVLSAPAVDPSTLAPKGTVLNAEKANDARAAVRVPFTQIIPTAIKTVDFSNDASSGAGWTIGENGLPKLPITSVLAVVGVGGLILEAASHAPVLSLFMPRVLSVAGWLAAAGYLLDKRAAGSSSSSTSA
ncbi:hypothetical protein OEZ86_014558 [Tetradesmus obliquus]|nr:hypothetical protein OEZ86_014558 [Tetradesmus obliquus]